MSLDSRLLGLPDRTVEFALSGEGEPLIVLEAGCTDDLSTWSPVFAELAKRSETLAYSRPGYGRSTLVQTPRDVPTEAQELHQFLVGGLGKSPPYLLVGHSLGGLIVQAFAAAYPDEVAGMVLIDPTPLDLIDHLRADVPEALPAFYEAWAVATGVARQEFEFLHPPHGGRYPGATYRGPVIVLGAWLLENLGIENLRHYWRTRRIPETVVRYPCAELRKIACGHYIQRERPLAVIEAVDEVLARARSPLFEADE